MEEESQSCEDPHPPPKKKTKLGGKRKREEFILGDQEPTHQRDKKQVSKEAPQLVVPKIGVVVGEVESGAENQGKQEKGQLGAEVERAHNSLGETLECPYCPKVLPSSFALKRHAITHEKKRFKCEICEKLLSRKDNLMAHKRNVHGHVFEPPSKDTTVEHHVALEPDEEGGRSLDEQLPHSNSAARLKENCL